MSLTRHWIPSPNYSSRGGANVRLIVIHTAEGSTSYQSLGNYFANPASQVSSHVGIDDSPGTIGEYVRPSDKAWTAMNANPVAIQAELCGFARWTTAEWENNHSWMLDNCAKWIAEEASRFSIPIVKLSPQEAQGNGRGVCAHSDLGAWGGNHSDPGTGFPWNTVIDLAGGSGTTPPSTTPPSTATAPPFPYPNGHYIGQPSQDIHCHSGCYGGGDSQNTRTWQQQMKNRGWNISVDGCYGPQSENVCTSFQREKGLTVDGLVGIHTWKASWEAPVT